MWRGTARLRGQTGSGGPSLASSRAGATWAAWAAWAALTVSIILATWLARTMRASGTTTPPEAAADTCEWQPLPALPSRGLVDARAPVQRGASGC